MVGRYHRGWVGGWVGGWEGGRAGGRAGEGVMNSQLILELESRNLADV